MEEHPDSDYIDTLKAKLRALQKLGDEGQYATHVYVTDFVGDDDDPSNPKAQIYLPEVIERAILESVDNEELQHFDAIWRFFAGYNYVSYMDGSPIEILALATAWLAVGLDIATGKIEFEGEVPPPFRKLTLALNEDARNKKLLKLIVSEIQPTLLLEASTNVVFTRINLINAALRFTASIEMGLKSQARLIQILAQTIRTYEKITPLPAYDDILTTGAFVFDLVDGEGNGVEVVPGSHLDIFDSIACSPIVPVCICNGDEIKTGKAVFEAVNDRIIKVDSPKSDTLVKLQKAGFLNNARSLCIVMYVYLGDDESKASEARLSKFGEVIFSFKKGAPGYNKFTATFKHASLTEILITRLNRHMRNYRIAVPRDTSKKMSHVEQSFIIPSLNLDKDMLIYFATTDVTNSLFKFDEREKPWTQKKILTFAILLVGSVKMVVKAEVVDKNTIIVIDRGRKTALVKGDHIVTITLTAQNMDQYTLARFVILRFFSNYVTKYEENYRIFSRVFTEHEHVNPIVPISVFAEGDDVKDMRNIKQLAAVDPPLWMFCKYTRVAASNVNQQVKPIRDYEVQSYLDKGRMVIKWPTYVHGLPAESQTRPSINPTNGEEIRVFYTTFSSENPFIALVPNLSPNNSITHPYIPKCQKTESSLVVNEDWTITMTQKEKLNSRSNKKTLRLLSPGETGVVNGSINYYLGSSAVNRYGVLKSRSSLLHCVMFAISEIGDDYHSIHTTQEAEKLIISMREDLVPYASACLQENPTKTVEQIQSELADPQVYLDPRLYFRACEEFFGVNIFMASPNETKELLIEAPNFSSFYTRTKRRPLTGSIVVIRLPLPHSPDDSTFQCEVLYVAEGEMISLFADETTTKLEEATNRIAGSIKVRPVCSIRELEDGKAAAIQSISVENPTPNILLPASFLSKLNAMKIDSHGKCRGVQVKLRKDVAMWIVTPPIEPLCGPNAGDKNFTRVEAGLELGEVKPMDVSLLPFVISELFQDVQISYTPKNGKLIGFWSSLHGMEVYVPLKPSEWLDSYSPVRYDIGYNVFTGESATQKLQRLQRVVTVSIQIMKRLFILSGLSAEDFVDTHMVHPAKLGRAMTTKGGSRLIPVSVMRNFGLLLDHFTRQFPSLFMDGKLLCDSKEYLLNMRQRLINFERVVEKERRAQISNVTPEGETFRLTNFPPYLEWFYTTYEDFSIHTNTQLLFMSTDRLNLEIKMQEQAKVDIVKRIDASLLGHRNPYIYIHSTSTMKAMFLVQNVENGDVSRAATVAVYWAQNRVNPGYHCSAIVPEINVKTVTSTDLDISDPFEPMIFKYQNGQAAALLSLNEK